MVKVKNGLVRQLHIKNDHLVWRKGEKYSAVYQSKGKLGPARVLDCPGHDLMKNFQNIISSWKSLLQRQRKKMSKIHFSQKKMIPTENEFV